MSRENKAFFLVMSLALIVAIASAQLFIVPIGNKPIEFQVVDGDFRPTDSKKYNFIEEEKINFSIDNLDFDNKSFSVYGWAIIPGDKSSYKIKVLLRGTSKAYMFDAKLNKRQDVTAHFNDNNNYDMSGFELYLNKVQILPDNYNVYIILEHDNKYLYKDSGQVISISNSKATELNVIDGKLQNDDENRQLLENNQIKSNIDKISFDNDQLVIAGWAFEEGEKSKGNIKVLLKGEEKAYMLDTESVERKDVSSYFKNDNYNMSGFKLGSDIAGIAKGEYEVYIAIQNRDNYTYVKTGRKITNEK